VVTSLSGTATGFGRRFAALIYDGFLLAALLILFTFAALVFTGGHAIMRDTAGPWYYLYCAGEIGVVAGYYLVNWLRSGQTLGMRAWQLRRQRYRHAGQAPLGHPAFDLRLFCLGAGRTRGAVALRRSGTPGSARPVVGDARRQANAFVKLRRRCRSR
jgi:hypothetical protein